MFLCSTFRADSKNQKKSVHRYLFSPPTYCPPENTCVNMQFAGCMYLRAQQSAMLSFFFRIQPLLRTHTIKQSLSSLGQNTPQPHGRSHHCSTSLVNVAPSSRDSNWPFLYTLISHLQPLRYKAVFSLLGQLPQDHLAFCSSSVPNAHHSSK